MSQSSAIPAFQGTQEGEEYLADIRGSRCLQGALRNSGCDCTGQRPQTAEVHMEGEISVRQTPVSSHTQKADARVWAHLMVHTVKNLPAVQETQGTWLQSLGQEDPLEKRMATFSSILA